MPSHAIIVALEADIALYRSYRIDPCVPTRVLAGSLRCRLQDEKPAGTLWVTLTAACSHFLGTGTSLNDFKAQIGFGFKDFLTSDVGAVEQKYDGKRTLFIPGSEGTTDLKRVLALCDALKEHSDVLPLFYVQTLFRADAAARKDLVQKAGGNSGVAQKLSSLRGLVPSLFGKFPDVVVTVGRGVNMHSSLASFISAAVRCGLIVDDKLTELIGIMGLGGMIWRSASSKAVIPSPVPHATPGSGLQDVLPSTAGLPFCHSVPTMPPAFSGLDVAEFNNVPYFVVIEAVLENAEPYKIMKAELSESDADEVSLQPQNVYEELAKFTWSSAKAHLQKTSLTSPLWGRGSAGGLTLVEVHALALRFDRGGGNKNAARNRASATSSLGGCRDST